MKKKLLSLVIGLTFLVSSVAMAAPKAKLSGNITCSGSTALLPLVKSAAVQFMKNNPDVNITVSGGGSGTGIQQASDGIVDIGNSDVIANKPGLVDHPIAIIPFAIIVNPDVNVKNLTQKQLVGLLSGSIQNWKSVGGKDQAVTIVTRQASSGSRMTIQTVVMKNTPISSNAIICESNGALKSTVASTPGAIGYIDFPYVDSSIKALSYNGIAPTNENVKNGKYTITTFGHMYTKGNGSALAQEFIKYIKSPSVQNTIVVQNKFIPLQSKTAASKATKVKLNVKTGSKKSTKKVH